MRPEFPEFPVIPIEVIISNLASCICRDEPSSEKYLTETEYWLEKLVGRILAAVRERK